MQCPYTPGGALAPGDLIFRKLAEETGGQLYVGSKEEDFPAIFGELERQMRPEYSVCFPPERQTPGFHELRIETTSSRNLRVRF